MVAIVVDRYDEDWTRLGWVMLRGRAEILRAGTEHDRAQELLRSRYRQLAAMQIAERPVIAVPPGAGDELGQPCPWARTRPTMMVKPRGCCDRNGVSPGRRTPRSCNPARCVKLDKPSLR